MLSELPYADEQIVEANRKHDLEHGNPWEYNRTRVKTAWKSESLIRGKKLNDRLIKKYDEKGRYTEAYREASRALLHYKKTGKLPTDSTSDTKLVFTI